MSDTTKTIHDPDLYRRMSEPYASNEEAHAAMLAFLDDVSEARERHRISNVITVAVTNVNTDDGVKQNMSIQHRGAADLEIPILCEALKQAQLNRHTAELQAAGLLPTEQNIG